MEAFSWQRLR